MSENIAVESSGRRTLEVILQALALFAVLAIILALTLEGSKERVYFESPDDGATVSTTFSIIMGAEGLRIEPAGLVRGGAGHFHLLIDADFIAPGDAIPSDEQHRHFGDGSTQTELTLEPGEHTLRLQVADGAHIAQEGEAYRAEITVVVGE